MPGIMAISCVLVIRERAVIVPHYLNDRSAT